jgi:hypothetical protein
MFKIAHFMGDDSDRHVFNRFTELRTFVLLRLQRRLKTYADHLENRAAGMDDDSLETLAMKIEHTLKEYGRGHDQEQVIIIDRPWLTIFR